MADGVSDLESWLAELEERRISSRVYRRDIRVEIDGKVYTPMDWSAGGFRLDNAPDIYRPGVVVRGAYLFTGCMLFGSFNAVARWRDAGSTGFEFIDIGAVDGSGEP